MFDYVFIISLISGGISVLAVLLFLSLYSFFFFFCTLQITYHKHAF